MEQHGISKLDLKRQNRMQVLKILKHKGPTSRIDIAEGLELTRAAVTIITNEMIDQGIIQEIGEYKHDTDRVPRGRKKILLDINRNYKFVVGVSIDENVASVGLSTLGGDVLDKRNIEIAANTNADAIFDFAVTSIMELMNDNCLENSDILGIGLGIFPNMYNRLGISCTANVPDYTPIRKRIAEITSLPLVIDNSVKGSAMANIDFLKDRGEERINTAFLQYGNSMHYAVINLNDPLKSYDYRTDFVDRMIVDPRAEEAFCSCGRKGCVQSELTPFAIFHKIKKVYSKANTPVLYELTGGDPEKINFSAVAASYKQGDPPIVGIYDDVLTLLTVLLNNLYYGSNPQKIALHNFVFLEKGYENLLDRAREIGGEPLKNSLEISIIDHKHRFLSGCALAIRELFFTRGGYDLSSL